MPIGYFSKFPTIQYDNYQCTDITRRVKLDDKLRTSYRAFYPYDVPDGLRSDHLADAYYSDPTYDYLIYLATEIVDPYYGWPLNNQVFDRFIEDKYGSIETAQQKIRHWQIQWDNDDQIITASYWNSLPDALKKYYTPQFDQIGTISGYQRKQQDYTVNTNKIVRFDITLNSANQFSNQEFVDFKHSGEIIGTAEIVTANSSVVFVQHVSGNHVANSTYSIDLIGETTIANGTSNNSVLVYQTVSNDEIAYWSSVSYYDYEQQINEQRKTVIALRDDLVANVVEQLTLKLMEQ